MKLGASPYGLMEMCRGSSVSILTTVWFASWRPRRKRDTRIAVILREKTQTIRDPTKTGTTRKAHGPLNTVIYSSSP